LLIAARQTTSFLFATLCRTLERTFKCDEYLAKVEKMFINGADSLTQAIEHSPWLQVRFKECCKRVDNGMSSTISNLRSAKHRYESQAMPAGRTVMLMDALIALADEMLLNEGPKRLEVASHFLEELDEESVVQNGMIADAAHEALSLIRFLDDGSFPLEQMSYEVGRFLTNIHNLFMGAGCFSVKACFTAIAVDGLKQVRMIRLRGGEMRALGGPHHPDPHTRARCLQRMCAWVRIAQEVISTEFPSWELFQSFSVLKLSKTERARGDNGGDDNVAKECIERLANRFKVSSNELAREIHNYKPLALHIFRTTSCGSFEAWREALLKRRARARTAAEKGDQANLAKVIMRLPVYSPSSSAVEQSFTRYKWAMREGRGHLSEMGEVVNLKLLVDRRPDEEEVVIGRAQEIWSQHYGFRRERQPG